MAVRGPAVTVFAVGVLALDGVVLVPAARGGERRGLEALREASDRASRN